MLTAGNKFVEKNNFVQKFLTTIPKITGTYKMASGKKLFS